ncbi:MAG: TlpA disulfide reductase family protein [Bacteroidota bacterium]
MAATSNFSRIGNILLIVLLAALAVRYFYMKPKYGGGEPAPNIEATDISGKAFTLEQLEGQFVLVDFWGSWCGPCRQENPFLVALYDNYHDKPLTDKGGLEIVSIGVENSDQRWKRAIEKDGLRWPHHILDQSTSLRFFNGPISEAYGIKEVPTKYLINPEGEIMEANPSIERIQEILDGQLD